MSFNLDLKKFADKTNKNLDKVIRGTALSLFSKVVLRTPVDTGVLRGNWQASLHTPASGSPSGGVASPISSIAATVSRYHGGSIYLTNNLPYAQVIEKGSSDQAPQGMVRVTVLEFQRAIKNELRKVR